MNITEKFIIKRYIDETIFKTEDICVVEYPLSIHVNGEKIGTLLCTPQSLRELTIGYLFAEGFIDGINDIESICISEEHNISDVQLIHNKKTLNLLSNKITDKSKLGYKQILNLANKFGRMSQIFRLTGGVHSCCLSDEKEILIFEEDIGRHNAFDKILGKILSEGIDASDKMIISSGRVSSETVGKTVRIQIPVLVSLSAPMNAAIKLARQSGLTLIGFAKDKKMNIYNE